MLATDSFNCICMDAYSASLSVQKHVEFDEQTTDCGSSASETEASSSCSESVTFLSRRRHQSFVRVTARRNRFTATLETIPGTPVAKGEVPRGWASKGHGKILSTGAPSDGDHALPTSAAPPGLAAPKRNNSTAIQMWPIMPMKLQLPKHLQNMKAHLQPILPAKKRPAFPEFTATTAAMLQEVDKTLPLKLHISDFLLEPPVLTVPIVSPR